MQAYRNLLGDSWSRLTPGVRLALSAPLEAVGTLEIRRTTALLTRLVPLPPEGPAVETSLSVSVAGNSLVWVRVFGAMRAASRQWVRGNRLIEKAALFELELSVREEEGAAIFEQTGLLLFGLRVPGFLRPTTSAILSAGPDERSWHVEVTIGHGWFGTLMSYRGVMRESVS